MDKKIKLCALTTISKTMDWFVVDSMRNLEKNGYDITLVCNMDEEFIADKSWIFMYAIEPTSNTMQIDGSNWFIEMDFTVNKEPTGKGQFHISLECISDYENWLAPTTISADVDGEVYISSDVATGTFAYTLNDKDEASSISCDNNVVFTTTTGSVSGTAEYTGFIGDALSTISGFSLPTAAADGKQFLGWSTDGSTVLTEAQIKELKIGYETLNLKAVFQAAEATYNQNVYTMGTDGEYSATAVTTPIGASTGETVNASKYIVPAGFTLDT